MFKVKGKGLFRKTPSKGNVLDGKKIKALLGDEKEFNKFLNQYFDLLDEDKSGKLSREEMQPALVRFGELLGLPPPGTAKETDEMVTKLFTHLMAENSDAEIDRSTFIAVSREFLSAISDELAEKPLVVEVYDTGVLKELSEDKEHFKQVVRDVFAQFDDNMSGGLTRDELRDALISLGILPPHGAKPEADALVSRTLGKYGGADLEVDIKEFEQMLRDLIRDLSDELAAQPVLILPVVSDSVVVDGSFLRKLVRDSKKFQRLTQDTFTEWDIFKKGRLSHTEVGIGFKKFCTAYHVKLLSPSEAEALCKEVFEASDQDKSGFVEKDEFEELLRQMMLKLAQKLDKDPVLAKNLKSNSSGKSSRSGSDSGTALKSATSSGGSEAPAGGLFGWFSGTLTAAPTTAAASPSEPHARSAEEIKAARGYTPSGAVVEARQRMEERGKKLRELADTTEELDAQSKQYEDVSAQLAEKMKSRWW